MAKLPTKGPIQNKKKMAMSNFTGASAMKPLPAPAANFKKGGKVAAKSSSKSKPKGKC